jgi:hypothetical protein
MLVLRRRLEAQRFPNRIRLAERDPRRIEVLNETLRQQTKYFGQLTVSNIFDNEAQFQNAFSNIHAGQNILPTPDPKPESNN